MGDMTIRPEDVPVVDREVTETEVLANATAAGGERDLRITDSTLRDGSHAMSHQFTEEQVRGVVSALDRAGVQVIEVTHGDGLGGSSFNYGFSLVDELDLIRAAVDEATQAKIAVLMLPWPGDSPGPQAGARSRSLRGSDRDPLHRGRRVDPALRRGTGLGHGDRRFPDAVAQHHAPTCWPGTHGPWWMPVRSASTSWTRPAP